MNPFVTSNIVTNSDGILHDAISITVGLIFLKKYIRQQFNITITNNVFLLFENSESEIDLNKLPIAKNP